jgi:hypothetical protein
MLESDPSGRTQREMTERSSRARESYETASNWWGTPSSSARKRIAVAPNRTETDIPSELKSREST